jgi:hypothetical protein
VKAKRGWKRPFDDPIPLPHGRQLVTLEDAGTYITKLPNAVHEAEAWQAAMESLILVATLGGPTMFARIGVMRALNRHVDRVFAPIAQRQALGKAEAKEGSMTGQSDGRTMGLQFSFAVAAGACCGCSSIFSAASIALRRFNAAVGLHRSRPVVMNFISTLPSGTAFRMRAASSTWIEPPNIPCVGDKSK